MHRGNAVVGIVALMLSTGAPACWTQAGERYQISPHLLHAIAKCESALRPGATNRTHLARTGTYDIGLMQINSSHLPALRKYGIGEQELHESCTNINVGAWILAGKIRQHGLSWEAVGAYNAACTRLKGRQCQVARSKYAWCVYRNLPAEFRRTHREAQPRTGAAAAAVAMPILSMSVTP